MKAVILAGGLGTRLSEETGVRPKPMVEIGGRPILWHIMKTYSHYNINEFIICCGQKSQIIKEYFFNYHINTSDVTFDLAHNSYEIIKNDSEKWKVTLVQTGVNSMTGGRLKRVQKLIGKEQFCFTYGDGVTNLDISKLVAFHNKMGGLATLTAVQPPGRYGAFTLSESQNTINNFWEKPVGDGAWINGGYFVLEPEIFDYIKGDETIWEHEPLKALAHKNKLFAYRHTGFWQNMDTLRDKFLLEKLWNENAPWKVWEE